jgi:hypothetical protein
VATAAVATAAVTAAAVTAAAAGQDRNTCKDSRQECAGD